MVLAGEDRGTRKNNRNRLSFEIYEAIQGQHTIHKLQAAWVAGQLLKRRLAKRPTPLNSPKKTLKLSSREQPSISPCCCPSPTLLSRPCPYLPDLMLRVQLHMEPKVPAPPPHTLTARMARAQVPQKGLLSCSPECLVSLFQGKPWLG